MIPLLYAIAVAVLTVYGVNLLVLALASAGRDRLQAGEVPPAVPEGEPPVVTVQLPLYNERYVAERLIDACARLRYPAGRLEIQVLDDSTDDTSEIVRRRVLDWRARGVDVVHLRRTDRTGYKAGALQAGLRAARGEFFALFDADFVPQPDFLLRMMPRFDDPGVGLVQARWSHLNAGRSLLTRLQAAGLDAHFAVEQLARNRTGCFMSFNGTAGVWRRACIEAAGGWRGETLTEDLDLSYRAQLAGWRFRFVPGVEVPAELPERMTDLRQQQFRWAKGAVETAILLSGPLWRSDFPLRVRLEGILHLTNHLVFPFTLLAALLHAPLFLLRHYGRGPGEAYFGLLGAGLLAFAGVFLAQLFAQRALYPDWPRRMRTFPWLLAGTLGLALSNSRAVAEAVLGRRSPFVRTPKPGARGLNDPRYTERSVPAVAWGEAALALYATAGCLAAALVGEWTALPFQLLLAVGFTLVSGYSFGQSGRLRLRSFARLCRAVTYALRAWSFARFARSHVHAARAAKGLRAAPEGRK